MRVVSSAMLPRGRFEGAQYGPTTISMILDDEPPGAGPRLHRHPYDETWIVLEGDLEFELATATLARAPETSCSRRPRCPTGSSTAEPGTPA